MNKAERQAYVETVLAKALGLATRCVTVRWDPLQGCPLIKLHDHGPFLDGDTVARAVRRLCNEDPRFGKALAHLRDLTPDDQLQLQLKAARESQKLKN